MLVRAIIVGLLLTLWSVRTEAAPPNIVLVFADDLGVNDLACYGRGDHRTPNLDRLAQSGMRFTRAYTAQPICSPSRAALMTGKCPARLHLTNFLAGRADASTQKLLQPVIEGQLPLEEVTVAEILRDAGYATGMFGKWHLGNKGFGPEEQGFTTAKQFPGNSKITETEAGKSEYGITAAAEAFIEANKDKPFFCYVPHNNPHIPIAARPELVEKHKGAFHPEYAAMIETLDDAVGRLMAKVEQLGLSDNTIFIFTSDNGGLHVLEFPGTPATHNSPYRAGKGYLYEGGLREPLIVRWPNKVAAGSVCDAPMVLMDLVPTLLEAAGIDVAKTVGPLDGESIIPLLRGETPKPRTLFWHFPNYTNQGGRPAGAVIDGQWKLVEQYEDGRRELYNLKEDVTESNDVSSVESERVKAMGDQLHDWLTRVGAQIPVKNPDFEPKKHAELYVTQDPSKLKPEATAAATEPKWKAWRTAMNDAVKGNKPKVTPATGDIRLQAKDARVHGEKLRYEPPSNKNVLGYWTNPQDWADWEFEVKTAGEYEVEVQQGCGKGNGGAEVDVVVDEQKLSFKVVDTGHFQHMIQITIGKVKLQPGKHQLAIRPRNKPGVAVMDVRRVVLRPVE